MHRHVTAPRARPTLVVVLHGDAPFRPPKYQHTLARQVATAHPSGPGVVEADIVYSTWLYIYSHYTHPICARYPMAFSEAALKENYRNFSDEKLMRLAAEDAAKLRPEALALLQEELGVRGLAEVAQKEIAAQFRVLSEAEVEGYCALIQAVPCPICHSSTTPLNATITNKVSSFIFLATWKEELAIACPNCLDKLSESATSHSIIVGWWGIPWGIIRTIKAINSNKKMARSHHVQSPNSALKAFVVDNVRSLDEIKGNVNHLHAFLLSLRLK
jgi:hypothetical protein